MRFVYPVSARAGFFSPVLNSWLILGSNPPRKFILNLLPNCMMDNTMKKLFLSTLLVAFAVAAQAGGEECAKAAGKSGCPAQAEKSGSCCGGSMEQTKAATCPAMKKNTETTSKQKLQSPKDSTLAKK
jgi:hypothetical protein